MVHRDDPHGFTIITQPAHAWLSGQLARAWGNKRFGTFEPHETVCLAAEQHDIGWLEWERAPTLNPKTGKPYSFMELPVPDHTGMWASAGALAKIQGRYSALLISLHGSGLYERRDSSNDSPQDTELIKAYLKEAHAFEGAVVAELKRDEYYAPFVRSDAIARNRRLIGVWDYLSLLICMGLKEPRTMERVPVAKGAVPLTLSPIKGSMTEISVSPWPFKTKTVSLIVEGRRMPERFSDQEAMRSALAAADWVTLKFSLQPQ